MTPDRDELYEDDDYHYGRVDDYSELGPDDSASQIGRVVTTEELARYHAGYREQQDESSHTGNGAPVRPYSRPDAPTTPPSNRTSLHSSRLLTPTTLVPSKQDRVRYSWQSIHGDEPSRPRIHVIKIVSNTATASAGMPGGESLGFSISPGGRRTACYNSARLFILQTAALPVNISQEFALKRRPLAVEVVDDGNTLAVLADEHTINVYTLSHHSVQRIKTFHPDFPASTIALSPTGALLAAAYDGGVEVFALGPDALSTDRRAARSARMDKLVFSEDGSTLLGTTTRVNTSATVSISVPVFPAASDGIPTHEELKEAWCTNILEPQNINNSCHAAFFRENSMIQNDRLFAWNGSEDTFGILNTQDLEYTNVDFPVTISPPLSTCGGLGAAIHAPPAIDERGDTVAMIVNDRTVRLYVVPHAENEETKVEAHSIDHELDEEFGCPFSDIRWVYSHANLPAPTMGDPSQVSGRLVVVSPGGVTDGNFMEDSVQDIEGGRIVLFDFDPQFAGQPGQTFTLTLGKAPPLLLDEQEMDVAQEVALVRRRTVNQSVKLTQRTPTLGRAASSARRGQPRQLEQIIDNSPNGSTQQSPVDHTAPNGFGGPGITTQSELSFTPGSEPPLADVAEVVEGIEEPYDHNSPRSKLTLQRAASAATNHRVQHFEERRAEAVEPRENGLMLPRYAEEPNTPLPGRYRAMAGLEKPGSHAGSPYTPDPNNTNGLNNRPSLESIRSRPVHDTPVAAPSTIPENGEPSFHTPYTPPMAPAAFAGGPMPRSLQRAYSNAIPNSASIAFQQSLNQSSASAHNGWQNGINFYGTINQAVPNPSLSYRGQEHENRFVHQPSPNSSPSQRGREHYAPSTNGHATTTITSPTGSVRHPQSLPESQNSSSVSASAAASGSTPSSPRRSELERQQIRERLERPPTDSRLSAANFAPVPVDTENAPPLPTAAFANGTINSAYPFQTPPPTTSRDIVRSQSAAQPPSRPADQARGRSRPPRHVAAMHHPPGRPHHDANAFHSSDPHAVSSSLFPMNPNSRRHSVQPAGSVAHPVLNWIPPAPSVPPSGPGMHGNTSSMSLPVGGRRSSSRAGSRSSSKSRSGSGRKRGLGRRTPKYYFEDGNWVLEEKKCVVM